MRPLPPQKCGRIGGEQNKVGDLAEQDVSVLRNDVDVLTSAIFDFHANAVKTIWQKPQGVLKGDTRHENRSKEP